ncbi:NADH dehydrogenase [Sphingomonas sp. Leaf412]|uniref:nitroreductase n=1 Tax=Sphingomonas sp. Leaf412 TaxID=1736370 RepID=UPI0006FE635C|nr:nitroreductase [Sphingomonas sp. Leaf412]KQT31254.1 NADH dehydrogenase [Sphingomonas sp. Leaf412]
MDVTRAVAARRSVRGFLDREIDLATLKDLAIKSSRAATGGNIQPWHVDIVHGESMKRLKAIMAGKIERRETETPGYDIYPREMDDLYRQRTFAIGEEMYGRLGIPREDKKARAIWFARNFQFFGAPAAYFVTVDRRMGPPQWSDLGMYLQTLMLLAVEHGLATCPQECWAVYPKTVEAFLEVPEERMLFCGVAIGYEDTADPANATRSARAPEEEWLVVRG